MDSSERTSLCKMILRSSFVKLRFVLAFIFPGAGTSFVMKIISSNTKLSVSGIALLDHF